MSKQKNVRTKAQNKSITSQLRQVETRVEKGVFVFSELLSIAEFSKKTNIAITNIIKIFFDQGIMLNQNTILSEQQIGELCLELGLDFKKEKSITHENLLENYEFQDKEEDLQLRPPVVTIMGHVDHGKTTLLDRIRKSNIIDTEHGGITQHIGAYQVLTKKNKKLTFLDTPGHEAFTEMRARGSAITDIVALVVAANDGVMPQTKEAIDHAKAAEVPIVVFVNKLDIPGSDPDKVMGELAELDLLAEEWGGNISFIKGSARSNEGIDELLDNLLLIGEMNELKVNPNRFATGTVIEAHLDRSLGPVATLLVQSGTLKVKDALVVGHSFGYVRDLKDEHGKKVTFASPSTPIRIHGLDIVPNAGDKFMVFRDEKLAREVALSRKTSSIISSRSTGSVLSLENMGQKIKEGELKKINIILKADTQGSVEAVKSVLMKINIEGVKINIIRASVGAISTSDLSLALASSAIVYGFNVRPTGQVRNKALDMKVDVRLHDIIYKISEELEEAANGMLDPEQIEKVLGQAEVRKLFRHSDIGTIAGCHVIDGLITRKSLLRILRDGVVIYSGEISSLKRGKEDIKEAKQGQECGLTIKNFNDLKENDIIEAYIIETVGR